MDEARLNDKTYNWGYDPKNYNVPEGSYSTDPADPAARIREFKQMVQSLHRNGMRIVLDVVYNHTASVEHSNFNLTVPGYFYRHNADGSYSDASGCGNETASERAMVRHYIVESVKFWAKEYHIDGFRFDLMGIHDIETMNRIREELSKIDPTIFIYGEGGLRPTLPCRRKNGPCGTTSDRWRASPFSATTSATPCGAARSTNTPADTLPEISADTTNP